MNLLKGQQIRFAGNYCVKEIDEFLRLNFKIEVLSSFYARFDSSEMYVNTELLGTEHDTPLLKVLWNIFSRGIPTIASVRVSDFLLKKYFGVNYTGYFDNEQVPEIKMHLNKKVLVSLLPEYEELLQLPNPDDKSAAAIGLGAYHLYQLQKDLATVAQLQLALIILQLTGKSFLYKITGIDKELMNLAIDDLNEFSNHLNHLIVNSENRISSFNNTQGAIINIAINEKETIDEVLKQYEIEYIATIDFQDEIHGIQEVTVALKFKNWKK